MSMKIAIVDDDATARNNLTVLLDSYADASAKTLDIHYFENGFSFLNEFVADYDIVFMDIHLPDIDGLETARRMRKIDDSVILIFVTDLAQYAIKGYEVEAYDYIVKPVLYEHLSQKLNRISYLLREKDEEPKITVKTESGSKVINASSIKYLEIIDHRVYFHTDEGVFDFYGSLSNVEKLLPARSFVRCNHCYIVNLKYVTKIEKFEVYLGKDVLQISHPKKKQFLEAFTRYIGEHV